MKGFTEVTIQNRPCVIEYKGGIMLRPLGNNGVEAVLYEK